MNFVTALLDIPVYKNRVQSLHVLFSLYMEFKNSQVRTYMICVIVSTEKCEKLNLLHLLSVYVCADSLYVLTTTEQYFKYLTIL